MGRPIWPANYSSSKANKFGVADNVRPLWKGRAQIIESNSPFTNSFTSKVYINKYGQKKYENIESLSFPVDNQLMEPTVVRYPSKDFNDNGFFNGFPFMLEYDCEYLNPADNYVKDESTNQTIDLGRGFSRRGLTGISVDNHTSLSILGGGYNLSENAGYFSPNDNKTSARSVTANNFWNLAAIETDFVVQTRKIPDKYVTGYASNDQFPSEEGLQYITEDYEVVDSYSDQAYLPPLRQYVEITGHKDEASIDPETRLIGGSGQDYSSMFVLGHDTGHYADFFIPLTIQPSNTGAFTITTDKGVADYLESQPEWGDKKAFNCNMMLDFNTKDRDHEGFVGSNVEYHCFPYKAYIVPAKDWDFTVVGSKIKGIYYTYAQNEKLRFPGDQSVLLNYRSWYKDINFCYSKNSPQRLGGGALNYSDAGYTHIPFASAAGYADGEKDTTYAYSFSADSRVNFLTPKSNKSTEDSKYNPTFSSVGKYKAIGVNENLEYHVGGSRPSLVLSTSLIEKFFNKKFDHQTYRRDGKTQLTSLEISRLFYNLLSSRPADNRNLRKARSAVNSVIINTVESRTIRRKTRDYTTFSDSLSASTTRTPLDSSVLGFPTT